MFSSTHIDEKFHIVNFNVIAGQIKIREEKSYPLPVERPVVVPRTEDFVFITTGKNLPNKVYLLEEDKFVYQAIYDHINLVAQNRDLLYIVDGNFLIKFDLTKREIIKRIYLGLLNNDRYDNILVSSDYVIITIDRVGYFTLNFYIIKTDFSSFIEYFLEETELILGFINNGKTLVMVNTVRPICLVDLATCRRNPIILDFAWLNTELSFYAILEEEFLIIINEDEYYQISAKEGLFKLDSYRLKRPFCSGKEFAVTIEKDSISARSVYLYQEGKRIKSCDLPYYRSTLLCYVIDFYPQINGIAKTLFKVFPTCDLVTEILTYLHPSQDKIFLYKLAVLIGKNRNYQSKLEFLDDLSSVLR